MISVTDVKKSASANVITGGNILKTLCYFALPCIAGRVLQNLYNLVDTVIVGKALNMNALAAVGATGSLVSLFTDTVIGLMTGFSVVLAKKCGGGKSDELKSAYFNSLVVTALVGILLSALGMLFSRPMLKAMNTPEDIIDDACKYVTVIFAGLLASVFYNFFCEMLRALGNSRFPLLVLFISSVLHIALILLFLFVFKLGVVGAALSTVISQLAAAVICAVYIHSFVPEFRLSLKSFGLDMRVIRECLHLGLPMAVTSFVVMFGGIILSFVTNGIGTEYVAGYSCASKIGYIITTPIFGFASTAAVFVSQNYGARHFDRIKTGIRKINILVTLINLVLLAFVLLTGRPLIILLLGGGTETAVNAGLTYLNMRCFSMFALTFAAVYKSVLPAIGSTFFTTLSGFLEIGVRYLIPILFSKRLGFVSVPLTDAVAWIMLAVMLAVAYHYEFGKIVKKQKMKGERLNEKQVLQH